MACPRLGNASRCINSLNPAVQVQTPSNKDDDCDDASDDDVMTITWSYYAGSLPRGRSQVHGPCCSGLIEPGCRCDDDNEQ